MAVFEINKPIETSEPTIKVERLPRGQHTFRLIVVDGSGNISAPDDLKIEVGRL